MAKKTREIVEKNELYYGNYVIGHGRRFHARIAYVLIVFNAIVCGLISHCGKRIKFLQQAGTQNLGEKEVMEWVDEQARATTIDIWLIAGITLILILFIAGVNKNVKGYDLYKKKWIRWVPETVMALIFLGIIGVLFIEKNWAIVTTTILQGLQFVLLFKFLLPLELRKSYGRYIDVIEGLSNVIIKKL